MDRFYEFAEKAIEKAEEVGKRKRLFAAKSRMSEVERKEIGATRRERIAEAGRMTRGTAEETGREARHLREFGPEGVRTRESMLRFAPGGLVERGQKRTAVSAAGRLSGVMKERERKKGLEEYSIGAESLLGKELQEVDTEYGKDYILPSWGEQLDREAKVIAFREGPEAGLEFLQKGIAKHEKDIAFEEWLDSIGDLPLSEQKRLSEARTFYPVRRESRLSEAR